MSAKHGRRKVAADKVDAKRGAPLKSALKKKSQQVVSDDSNCKITKKTAKPVKKVQMKPVRLLPSAVVLIVGTYHSVVAAYSIKPPNSGEARIVPPAQVKYSTSAHGGSVTSVVAGGATIEPTAAMGSGLCPPLIVVSSGTDEKMRVVHIQRSVTRDAATPKSAVVGLGACKSVGEVVPPSQASCGLFTADGRHYVAGLSDGSLAVFNIAREWEPALILPIHGDSAALHASAGQDTANFSPTAAAGLFGSAGKGGTAAAGTAGVAAVALHPSTGSLLVSVAGDRRVAFVDLVRGRVITTARLDSTFGTMPVGLCFSKATGDSGESTASAGELLAAIGPFSVAVLQTRSAKLAVNLRLPVDPRKEIHSAVMIHGSILLLGDESGSLTAVDIASVAHSKNSLLVGPTKEVDDDSGSESESKNSETEADASDQDDSEDEINGDKAQKLRSEGGNRLPFDPDHLVLKPTAATATDIKAGRAPVVSSKAHAHRSDATPIPTAASRVRPAPIGKMQNSDAFDAARVPITAVDASSGKEFSCPADGEQKGSVSAHNRRIRAMTSVPGSRLATADSDGVIKIWGVSRLGQRIRLEQQQQIHTGGRVTSLAAVAPV